MSFVDLTEHYRGNSRAQRVIKHYRVAHEALQKLARLLRDERHPILFADVVDMLANMLLHHAGRNCEAAALPITGEVVAREVERS